MGVITSLIRANREKKAMDEEHQLRAFTLASQSDDPALKQWGIRSITELGEKNAPNPEVKKHIPILGKIAGLMGQMNPMPGAPKQSQGNAPKYDQGRADAEKTRQTELATQRQSVVNKQASQDEWTAKQLQQENEIKSLGESLANKQITQEEHDERVKEIRLGKPGKGSWHNVEITFPGTNVPPVAVKQNQTDGSFQTLDGRPYTPPPNASVRPVTAASGAPGPRTKVTIIGPDGKEISMFQDRAGKLYDVGGEEFKPPMGSRFQTTATKPTEVDKLANQLLLSGKVKDKEDAQKQAATMLVDVQKAKLKAAQSGGAGGGVMTPMELRALAQWQIATGQVPSFGLGANNPNRVAYQKQLAGELSGSGEGAGLEARAAFKGGSATLTKLMTAQGNIGAFERNARANIERAVKMSNQVGRTGSKLANEYLQWAQGNLEDYPLLANFRVAVDTAAKDYALVTTTATMGGVSTDSARAGAQALFNEHMPTGALEGAAESMYQDMDNRIKGLKDQIEETRGGIRTSAPKVPGAATPPAAGGEDKTYNGHTYHREKAGDPWKLVK